MRCPTYGLHPWRGRLESSCTRTRKGDRPGSEAELVLVYAPELVWWERIGRVSGLEFCAGDAALPDDRKECADGELWVVRNWDCDRSCLGSTLHHHMTAASPDLVEAVFFKNLAGVSARKKRAVYPCAASKRVMNTSV